MEGQKLREALRCHPDAQPEIRRIAEMMRDLYQSNEPRALEPGDWHLPMVTDEEWPSSISGSDEEFLLMYWPRVSAGRCARVSYLTHDGRRDPDEDYALYSRLVTSGHLSPLEHPARALHMPERRANFVGWEQLRYSIPNEAVFRPQEAA